MKETNMSFILEFSGDKNVAIECYDVMNVAEEGLEVGIERAFDDTWYWCEWTKEKGSTIHKGFKTLDAAVRDAETKIVHKMHLGETV
jgi:hypothetical protein|tara:strand:- start:153 stop:413 length:261 start_codon:yes stop_codon:yes gene_type:complete